MFTKILFYDNDGDLMMDYAMAAFISFGGFGVCGVMISLTYDTCIWFPNQGEDLIRELFDKDKVDLTRLGNAVWIDKEGNWSDTPKDKEEEVEE